MKLLFENWREFEKSALEEVYSPRLEHGIKDPIKPTDWNTVRQVASVADSSGVLSYPDVAESWEVVNAEPTYYNSSIFVINVLGAIPVLGKLGKLGKTAGRFLGLIDDAKDLSKVVRATKGGEKVADQLDTAARIAEDAMLQNQKARRAMLQHQKAQRMLDKEKGNRSKYDVTRRPFGDAGVKGARGAAKIAGHSPKLTKNGKLIGTWVDADGRAFITLVTEGAEDGITTFMYSSGTSYLAVDKTGQLIGSPRSWLPVKDWSGRHYQKLRPGDWGFGKGNPELWRSLVDINGEIGNQWYKWLGDTYGNDWPHKIYSNPKLTADVDLAIDAGAFRQIDINTVKRSGFGKYPEPGSEMDRIGKELLNLSPDGSVTDSLVQTFGSVRKGDIWDFNEWRRGWIVEEINESLLRKRRTKILISINKTTI